MANLFSEEELARLSDAVDQQLRELKASVGEASFRGDEEEQTLAETPQGKAIAQITQEPPKTFLQKFGLAAKSDLCEEGGMLYQQWKKWGDLENKEALERLGAVLMAMGFTGGALEPLAVATLVIILHLSVKTFCEEYSSKT